jgi:hypothetical protein
VPFTGEIPPDSLRSPGSALACSAGSAAPGQGLTGAAPLTRALPSCSLDGIRLETFDIGVTDVD